MRIEQTKIANKDAKILLNTQMTHNELKLPTFADCYNNYG